jgi:peptidoglycan/xylan/chitin deacetylase (PgdA/CDA1 family)
VIRRLRERRRVRAAERLRRRIERPPAHWSALFALLVLMALLLLVNGAATRTTGRSATPAGHSGQAPLAGRGALFMDQHGHLAAREPAPGRRVALTFDDGPDRVWTPRIAHLLERLRVPATFFVVGARAAHHPGLVAMLRERGFELGNHTFTHSNLTAVSSPERRLQLSLTEGVLAGAGGARSRLLRPPYSSTPDAVRPRDRRALEDVARRGYVIALADRDSDDWRRPGVGAIVRNATPPGSRGGVLLFHDGGGNRAETVAALRRLVPRLRARGFRFVDLAGLLAVSRRELMPPATRAQRLRGDLLIGSLRVARVLSAALTLLLAPIAALALLRAVVLFALARRHARAGRAGASTAAEPPVSVIVPAYNEAAGIERTVRSLVESSYPTLEVIVVDDGSTDSTSDVAARYPVRLIRQPNGGQGAAKNSGVTAARGALVAFLDGDDLWFPPKLSRQVELLEARPEAHGALARLEVLLEPGVQHPPWLARTREYPWFPPSAWLVRRSALEAAGPFDEDLVLPDFDWMLRARDAGLAFEIVPGGPLGAYRFHGENVSYRREEMREHAFIALRRSLDRSRRP